MNLPNQSIFPERSIIRLTLQDRQVMIAVPMDIQAKPLMTSSAFEYQNRQNYALKKLLITLPVYY
jgi:hypothetical protein